MKFLQKGILRSLMLTVSLGSGAAVTTAMAANPLVRVSTTYGDFTAELYQDRTPATVQNFLGYVDRGDYKRMVLHRVDKDFVIQAGSHQWKGDCVVSGVLPPACGPAFIPTQPEIVNEPGVSNVAGTLAMAKRDGFPNSATSQWFINLRDNAATLDPQNGGFTAFGRVLGDGMDVATRINQLSVIPVSNAISQLPVRDFDFAASSAPSEKNLVLMNVWRVDRFSSSLHVFEFRTGRLSTYVNAGTSGRLSMLLNVVGNTGSDTIFQIDPASVIPLAIEPEGMASFSMDDQRLRIPSVEVDDNGQVSVIRNVVLRMIDQASLRFVLESWDGPPAQTAN